MIEDAPPVGAPARLLADSLVTQAICFFLEEQHPGAIAAVSKAAHSFLDQAGPWEADQEEFVAGVRRAIDTIVPRSST